jgi:hypothetical protein
MWRRSELDMPDDHTRVVADDAANDAAGTRQCSRCRATFPADPDAGFTEEHAWWLCPPCSIALVGADRLRGWRAEK